MPDPNARIAQAQLLTDFIFLCSVRPVHDNVPFPPETGAAHVADNPQRGQLWQALRDSWKRAALTLEIALHSSVHPRTKKLLLSSF